MAGDFSTSARRNGARLAAVRQIHDGLGAQLQRHVHLLPFQGLVGQIARDAEVHVHLRGRRHALQRGTDAGGREACVVDVGREWRCGRQPRRRGWPPARGPRRRQRAAICGVTMPARAEVDLRDGPDGGGRCGVAQRRRRLACQSWKLPSLALPISGFCGSGRIPAPPLSLPGRHAAASSPSLWL